MEISVENKIDKVSHLNKQLKTRKLKNIIFHLVLLLTIAFSIIMLALLLLQVLSIGLKYLNWNFITSMPSRFPEKAGILSALVGSIWTIGLTALIALPLGVGTAIYLEEYISKNTLFNKILLINISNLAGVPSIVYGMLGLAVFVRMFGFERSILSGALTMALLILPIIIISSQEAIKSVPNSLREGSYALGMTKWQTITGVIYHTLYQGFLQDQYWQYQELWVRLHR